MLNALANFSQCGCGSHGGRGRGHGQSPQFGRGTPPSSSINFNLTCFTCCGFGHTSRQCPLGRQNSKPTSNVALFIPWAP